MTFQVNIMNHISYWLRKNDFIIPFKLFAMSTMNFCPSNTFLYLEAISIISLVQLIRVQPSHLPEWLDNAWWQSPTTMILTWCSHGPANTLPCFATAIPDGQWLNIHRLWSCLCISVSYGFLCETVMTKTFLYVPIHADKNMMKTLKWLTDESRLWPIPFGDTEAKQAKEYANLMASFDFGSEIFDSRWHFVYNFLFKTVSSLSANL